MVEINVNGPLCVRCSRAHPEWERKKPARAADMQTMLVLGTFCDNGEGWLSHRICANHCLVCVWVRSTHMLSWNINNNTGHTPKRVRIHQRKTPTISFIDWSRTQIHTDINVCACVPHGNFAISAVCFLHQPRHHHHYTRASYAYWIITLGPCCRRLTQHKLSFSACFQPPCTPGSQRCMCTLYVPLVQLRYIKMIGNIIARRPSGHENNSLNDSELNVIAFSCIFFLKPVNWIDRLRWIFIGIHTNIEGASVIPRIHAFAVLFDTVIDLSYYQTLGMPPILICRSRSFHAAIERCVRDFYFQLRRNAKNCDWRRHRRRWLWWTRTMQRKASI